MNPINVIIDTDPGVDDAMAICLALASKEIHLLGLTIVHGNLGDMHQLATNARFILECAGRGDVPVFVGAAKSIKYPPPIGAKFVHGDNGMGGVTMSEPLAPYRTDKTAVEFILETCRAYAGNITLVTLGPMTNLACALIACPALPTMVNRVYAMAGAFYHVGNISSVAEANVYNDPDAAAVVFDSDLKITLAPLNVTHKTLSKCG
jgi:purine nucleosidase